MSILVRGMKMPNEPRNCKFYDIDPMGFRKPYCKVQSVCNGLEDCPLIEVPEPHGRLIDADALIINEKIDTFSAVFAVAEAPTIIPASEVET